MGKVQVRIKAPFGEIVVEGNNAQEILDTLKGMPSEFMAEISGLVSGKLAPPLKAQLEGIVELTTEGPVITAREKLTHYESIGLTLYASEEKKEHCKPDNQAFRVERNQIHGSSPPQRDDQAWHGFQA